MPGREDAQNFIDTPPQDGDYIEEMSFTLQCILNESARTSSPYVPTAVILNFLAENGHEMTVTQWQQNVLGRLRGMDREVIEERYVFIGASSRGMFLLENESLAIEAVDFYVNRIASENNRLRRLREVFNQYNYPFPE